jgi:hypothetical protein
MRQRHGDHDPFEPIAIVYSQDELALLTSRLEHDGIWCVRHSGAHISADVGLTIALGGVKLLVHPEQAAEARELAASHIWERTGAVYDRSRAVDLLMALLLALLTGIPPPARIHSMLLPGRTAEA